MNKKSRKRKTKIQNQCKIGHLPIPDFTPVLNIGNLKLNDLPEWQKNYVCRFLFIYSQAKTLKGEKLKNHLNAMRSVYGKKIWSFQQYMRLSSLYEKYGILAIVPHWGKNNRCVNVKNEWFSIFTEMVFSTGAPDVFTCWIETYKQVLNNENINFNQFASFKSFLSKLKNHYSASTISHLEIMNRKQTRADTNKLTPINKNNSIDLLQLRCKHLYNIDFDPIIIGRLSPFEWLYIFEWLNILSGTAGMNETELEYFCINFNSKENTKFLDKDVIIEKRKNFKMLIECFLQSIINIHGCY